MTICIATIFEDKIIGIADRLTTCGILTVDKYTKIDNITPNVAVMHSGDASKAQEIVELVTKGLDDEYKSVKEIAELFSSSIIAFKHKCVERDVLSKFNLISKDFTVLHKEFPQILKEIEDYNLPHDMTTFVIAGVDSNNKPHLFRISDNDQQIDYFNTTGIVAIGAAYENVYSTLMTMNFSECKFLPEALFILYCAKREAENINAAVIGKKTDMFIIDKNGYKALNNLDIVVLNNAYTKYTSDILDVRNNIMEHSLFNLLQHILPYNPDY